MNYDEFERKLRGVDNGEEERRVHGLLLCIAPTGMSFSIELARGILCCVNERMADGQPRRATMSSRKLDDGMGRDVVGAAEWTLERTGKCPWEEALISINLEAYNEDIKEIMK